MYLTEATLDFLGFFFSPEVMAAHSDLFYGIALLFSLWVYYSLFIRPIAEFTNYTWARLRKKAGGN